MLQNQTTQTNSVQHLNNSYDKYKTETFYTN